MWKVCLFLAIVLPCYYGYPDGPPLIDEACLDMYPKGHRTYSQNEYPRYDMPREGPYEIVPEKTEYRPRERIKLTLKPTDFQFYKGFILEARKAICPGRWERTPLGQFSVDGVNAEISKPVNCDNKINSAMVHTTRQWKNDVEMTWYAPDGLIGHIVFVATVVRHKDIFWTGVNSTLLEDPTAPPLPICDSASFQSVSTVAMFTMVIVALFTSNRH